MPKQINTPSFGAHLVTLFNLKGRYQPVLDETIVPVVNVGLEEKDLSRRFAGTSELASTGLTTKWHFLQNPPTSNVMVIFSSVTVVQSPNAFWDFYLYNYDIVLNAGTIQIAALNGRVRDAFADDPYRAFLQAEETPPVFVGSRIDRLEFTSGVVGTHVHQEFPGTILMPGQTFGARTSSTVNGTTTVAWQWAELPLDANPAFGIL